MFMLFSIVCFSILHDEDQVCIRHLTKLANFYNKLAPFLSDLYN